MKALTIYPGILNLRIKVYRESNSLEKQAF